MNQIQTDIILEFQKSIDNMTRFGQEMESLDDRFGRLDQRVNALRSSMSALFTQMNKGGGTNLQQQLDREINAGISQKGIALAGSGDKSIKIDKESMQQLLAKLEMALNVELKKIVRNMNVEVNPNYANGQRIEIDDESINKLIKQCANVIQNQVEGLMTSLNGSNLIRPGGLNGIELEIEKSTITEIVKQIKQAIITKIQRPDIAEVSELKITNEDLQKAMGTIKSRLLAALSVDVGDAGKLDGNEISNKLKLIPKEIEESLHEYITKTVAGINGVMKGKAEIPLDQISREMKRIIAKELGSSVKDLQQLGSIDSGSIRSYQLKSEFERVSKVLDKKLNTSIQDEVTEIVRHISEVEVRLSPRLKVHIANQINRINNKLVEKIREQLNVQVQSLLQDIAEIRTTPGRLNGNYIATNGVGRQDTVGNSNQVNTIHSGNDAAAAAKTQLGQFKEALESSLRNALAGSLSNVPMNILYQATETFKVVQLEQIKMMQNLMTKSDNLKDVKDPTKGPDMTKVQAMLSNLQSFVRQQSTYYGTDYHQLYQVAGLSTTMLNTEAEMKEFIQLVAELKVLDPGADPLKVANHLENIKEQYGIDMAKIRDEVVIPVAAMNKGTDIGIEAMLAAVTPTSDRGAIDNLDFRSALVFQGTALHANEKPPADYGSYFKILDKIMSPNAAKKLEELEINRKVNDKINNKEVEREAKDVLSDYVKKMANEKDPDKVRDYNQAIFGTKSSKDGTPMTNKEVGNMHIYLDRAIDFEKKLESFKETEYVKMITESLDNPLVNVNRASQGWTIALDSVIQELTPAINTVSYALLNMSNYISENAQLFAKLANVLSTALLGMLVWKGMRGGVTSINGNAEILRRRTTLQDTVKAFGTGETGHLIDNGVRALTPKEIGRYQKLPEVDRYIQELHGMSQQQQDHFRKYVAEKQINIKDLPTLFSAMEESKSWEERKELSSDEKYNKFKAYNNRLSTSTVAPQMLNASLMGNIGHMVNSSADFEGYRANTEFASVSDRMSRMTQSEFDGFEKHLGEMNRNGSPAINTLGELSRALDEYDKAMNDADKSSRESSPTFVSLSHAVRGMNDEISRTDKLKNGFTKFLTDIPNLVKGTGMSIMGLAKGIAGLAAEIIGVMALGEITKNLAEEYTLTDNQKKLNTLDDTEMLKTKFANHLQERKEIDVLDFLMVREISHTLATGGNFLGGNFIGTDAQYLGYPQIMQMESELREYLKSKGHEVNPFLDLSVYFRNNNINPEELVAQWANDTGQTEAVQKSRQEIAIEDYKANQNKSLDNRTLQEIGKQAYEEERSAGKLKFANFDTEETMSGIQSEVNSLKSKHNIALSEAIAGGMATDSVDYAELRKTQIDKIENVYNEKLSEINKYRTKMEEMIKSVPADSQDHQDAQKYLNSYTKLGEKIISARDAAIIPERNNEAQTNIQNSMSKSQRNFQRIDLLAQAKELAAAYTMDTGSQAYLDAMEGITKGRIQQMRDELGRLKGIQATGDQSEELKNQILTQQNAIDSEKMKLKEYKLAAIGIPREKLNERSSDRENELLALKVRMGNPDDSSPVVRNKKIANAKTEVRETKELIDIWRKKLPGAQAEEAEKIQQEIRDLTKLMYQTQLGIYDEVKGTAGTFNLPDGVTPMSRYEYLTRGGTHQSTTLGMGDVSVHITLPNVTNGVTQSQLHTIGSQLGQGLANGRVGGWRNQMLMNPSNYRRKY
ncbi:hypothetical protein [Paenibacillus arenosi]|uniref:Phage tail tape measure protein n=1 Tax=Paenibacillus arenosi TaxID=2774142 RepID=A0ABR9B098_9BACL|nr:hypothetical protein [Paenibacillus arenosi]MBD8498890.1 hypothetical protein [Paenibacillus arenosi]